MRSLRTVSHIQKFCLTMSTPKQSSSLSSSPSSPTPSNSSSWFSRVFSSRKSKEKSPSKPHFQPKHQNHLYRHYKDIDPDSAKKTLVTPAAKLRAKVACCETASNIVTPSPRSGRRKDIHRFLNHHNLSQLFDSTALLASSNEQWIFNQEKNASDSLLDMFFVIGPEVSPIPSKKLTTLFSWFSESESNSDTKSKKKTKSLNKISSSIPLFVNPNESDTLLVVNKTPFTENCSIVHSFSFQLTNETASHMYGYVVTFSCSSLFWPKCFPPIKGDFVNSSHKVPNYLVYRSFGLLSHFPYTQLHLKWLSYLVNNQSKIQSISKLIKIYNSCTPRENIYKVSYPPIVYNKHQSDLCIHGALVAILSLSVKNLVQLITAMVLEIPVVVVSSNLAKLSRFLDFCLTLLKPFQWQSVYVPLLPRSISSIVQAPFPFIVGCNYLPPALLSPQTESILFHQTTTLSSVNRQRDSQRGRSLRLFRQSSVSSLSSHGSINSLRSIGTLASYGYQSSPGPFSQPNHNPSGSPNSASPGLSSSLAQRASNSSSPATTPRQYTQSLVSQSSSPSHLHSSSISTAHPSKHSKSSSLSSSSLSASSTACSSQALQKVKSITSISRHTEKPLLSPSYNQHPSPRTSLNSRDSPVDGSSIPSISKKTSSSNSYVKKPRRVHSFEILDNAQDHHLPCIQPESAQTLHRFQTTAPDVSSLKFPFGPHIVNSNVFMLDLDRDTVLPPFAEIPKLVNTEFLQNKLSSLVTNISMIVTSQYPSFDPDMHRVVTSPVPPDLARSIVEFASLWHQHWNSFLQTTPAFFLTQLSKNATDNTKPVKTTVFWQQSFLDAQKPLDSPFFQQFFETRIWEEWFLSAAAKTRNGENPVQSPDQVYGPVLAGLQWKSGQSQFGSLTHSTDIEHQPFEEKDPFDHYESSELAFLSDPED